MKTTRVNIVCVNFQRSKFKMMLNRIRKRMQDRRQCSYDPASNISPCTSPATTPTADLSSSFSWPSVYVPVDESNAEDMDEEEIYKTPTEKAVPLRCCSEENHKTHTDSLARNSNLKHKRDRKAKQILKKTLSRQRSSSRRSQTKEEPQKDEKSTEAMEG